MNDNDKRARDTFAQRLKEDYQRKGKDVSMTQIYKETQKVQERVNRKKSDK